MKKSTIITIIVVLVIIIGGIVWYVKSHETSKSAQNTNSQDTAYNSYTQEGMDETPADTGSTQTPVKLSYTAALKIYGSAGNNYRYQFANCSGTPGSLVMKKGTKFMIDNRDNKAHTIKIASQSYHLGGYGFAIVTAQTLGKYNITCDGGGAASITVEK